MKVFLSYSSSDKQLAGEIKKHIEGGGHTVFLAHEDIEPSTDWQERILAELRGCDAFLPLLTEHFYKSAWVDQETGVAVAYGKLVVPLKLSVDPRGFIRRIQALRIDPEDIPQSCRELAEVLGRRGAARGTPYQALLDAFVGQWLLTYGPPGKTGRERVMVDSSGGYFADGKRKFALRVMDYEESSATWTVAKVDLTGKEYHREHLRVESADLIAGHKDGNPNHRLEYRRQAHNRQRRRATIRYSGE